MKIEKVALIYFPINDCGGIITWNNQIQKGFKKLGVETMLFYATPTNKYTVDHEKDTLKERYTQLAGWHLSYNNQNLSQTLQILNSFDAVIFTKSSPHPTKDNLKYKDIENWKLLYSEVHVPKVVVFHDELWEKTNNWSKDVAEYVDICIAAQKRFIHCVNRYPVDCIKYHDFFPMDFDSIDKLNLHQKENFGMVATQWIKWKNHHKLLPKLPNIKVPIYLFGAGMEWHYLKKTEEYKKAIGQDFKMGGLSNMFVEQNYDDLIDVYETKGKDKAEQYLRNKMIVHNKQSPHKMIGTVRYEHLQEWYSKALFSIDLSTRGYTNYTHFEPLAYRTVSMIERRVVEDPDNIIPEDCCMTYDLEMIDRQVNWWAEDFIPGRKKNGVDFVNSSSVNKIRDRGQKFIRQAECKLVAKRIIENINRL